MAKTKKTNKRAGPKKKTSKGKNRDLTSSQTQQPSEQDSKRRIGQYRGAGEPPIMKK
jgi:hypothetical protein